MMLTVVMEVASDQPGVSPLLLVALVAPVALVVAVFLIRYRRKGDK